MKLLTKSNETEKQERYIVKKISDTEYQVNDTIGKNLIGEASFDFKKIVNDCDILNGEWAKIRERLGL